MSELRAPCLEGHDYGEPVVIRRAFWFLVFYSRGDCAVALCRRCGELRYFGYVTSGMEAG